jgi:hypothetical protein
MSVSINIQVAALAAISSFSYLCISPIGEHRQPKTAMTSVASSI